MMKLNKQTLEFEFVDTLTCFCGGGGDNDKDDNDSGPSTNPGSRERGRGAEPPAATGPSRPDNNRDNNNDRPSDNQTSGNQGSGNQGSGNQPTPITAAPTYPDGQNFGLRTTPSIAELEATLDAQLRPSVANFAELQSPNTFTATGSAMPPERVTDMAGTTFNTVTGEIIDDIGMNANTGLLFAGMDGPGTMPETIPEMTLDDGLSTPSTIPAVPSLPISKPPQRPIVGTPEMGFTDMMLSGAQRPNPAGIQARYGTEAPAVEEFIGTGNQFVPSVIGGLLGTATDNLMAGTGQPVYFPNTNQIAGTLSTGPFGGTVYSGQQIDGYQGPYQSLVATPPPEEGGADVVPPQTNPMTGQSQCPDGYIFDDDLQACRMKTRSESAGDTSTGTPSSDMYYRRTSLDTAPANTPAGFDFDAANRRFTQSYAYRPSFYNKPMDLTGFTKLL